MKTLSKSGLALVVMALVGFAVGLTFSNELSAQGKKGVQPINVLNVSPRYSVLDTEGHNLIVTDNQTNTTYFYTVDKGAEIGSELKLRGSVDLNQVGKDGITPKRHFVQK